MMDVTKLTLQSTIITLSTNAIGRHKQQGYYKRTLRLKIYRTQNRSYGKVLIQIRKVSMSDYCDIVNNNLTCSSDYNSFKGDTVLTVSEYKNENN